jgi:hypothetical protein
MECEFCKNTFSNKQNLNAHQKNAKYCLKIQGKDPNYIYSCNKCEKKFSTLTTLNRHSKICTNNLIEQLRKENSELKFCKKIIENLKKQLKEQKNIVKDLQNQLTNVALKAVSRPTHHTSNKTIQINNYIKNMQPLEYKHIEQSVPMLTLDHHVKGPEGYAEYALEFPFKDRIVCVDVARNKIKYKNKDGDVIEDVGFRKMMMKLCDALKDRSFKLCQDHYEKLARKFSEEEMDNSDFDFMEAAKAIHKFANGRESDFCTKIIKLISKGAKKN